ncbi:DUF1917-domain-containing protein [Ophiobolus disseminans]|uniref:DUF1917-domain-containing protein n=1 Tax=Ophiobolus disseminans TaxID=1469910 RepID=A0A6A6ZN03_9PLEO|nr:DUF1917-domain-containing protein [Ophiobolus disseminans]
MVEEEQVSGAGWISDDSSFYGDEEEQGRQLSRNDNSNLAYFRSTRKSDLNAITAPLRAQLRSHAMSGLSSKEVAKPPTLDASSKPFNFILGRGAMEEERLSRLGKRKREPSPEPILFNPGQGSADAWQLGESVDDFVRRLPPLTTSVFTCPWIWAHNPHSDPHDGSTSHRADEFRSRGVDLLDHSLQNRQQIQAKNKHGPRAALTKALNQESKELQQRITDLAAECGILSGKWMLFPKLEEVTQVWKKVVAGIIDGRLGPTAKVALDEGKPGDRLICIYTKDFRDEDDVLRVLRELETMGLLGCGRSIYYKSDAYTYLDLYKQTAEEYGLQASLYSSYKMMAAGNLAKAKSSTSKRQSTLNNYF